MRPKTCIRLVAASAFVVFALSVTVSPVRGDPAEDTQEKPSAEAEPILSPEEHYAKGEAKYDGAWMPIQKLFEMYVRERDQLRYIRQHGSAEQEQLQKLHREMALIRGEARQEQQPVRRELAKARNELRECNRILHLSPPSKPQLQRLPSPPRRPASGYDSDYDSSSGWYDKARRDWERQCEAIRRQNKVRMEQYQRELQAYQKKQNDAKQAVPKLEAKIKECMKELGEIEAEYEKKGAPTLRRSDQVTDRVRAHNRRVEVIEARVEAMTKALLAVPEPIRHKHGIVAFEGEFHTSRELSRLYQETQTEIDRVREKLKGDCEKADIPFPEDWRHPQQDRMDTIKTLLEAVEAARGEKG